MATGVPADDSPAAKRHKSALESGSESGEEEFVNEPKTSTFVKFGAFAVVHLKYEMGLAFKRYKYGSETAPFFIREIAFAKMVTHDHVLSMIDYSLGTSFDRMCVILPLCLGSARSVYQTFPGASIVDKMFTQILSAVDHVHALRFFHRDVNPNNILVSNSAETPCFLLSDFNTATAFFEGRRNTLCVTTMEYASPEMLADQDDYDQTVDYWSLAVSLLQMWDHHRFLFHTGERKVVNVMDEIIRQIPYLGERAETLPLVVERRKVVTPGSTIALPHNTPDKMRQFLRKHLRLERADRDDPTAEQTNPRALVFDSKTASSWFSISDSEVVAAWTDQRYINWRMRNVLVEWLAEVLLCFDFSLPTLYSCVGILDSYVRACVSFGVHIQVTNLQCVGSACLMIAADLLEQLKMPYEEMSNMTDGTFDVQTLEGTVVDVCDALGGKFYVVGDSAIRKALDDLWARLRK